jgi:hypothetical protein
MRREDLVRLIWQPESWTGSESDGRGGLERLPTTLTDRECQKPNCPAPMAPENQSLFGRWRRERS